MQRVSKTRFWYQWLGWIVWYCTHVGDSDIFRTFSLPASIILWNPFIIQTSLHGRLPWSQMPSSVLLYLWLGNHSNPRTHILPDKLSLRWCFTCRNPAMDHDLSVLRLRIRNHKRCCHHVYLLQELARKRWGGARCKEPWEDGRWWEDEWTSGKE